MPRTKSTSSSPRPRAGSRTTGRLVQVPLDRLRPHPANANVMTPERLAKLEEDIRREGDYPPLVDIDLIWRRRSNGIADIGRPPPLKADPETLRKATSILMARRGTVGERLIEVLQYLHDATGIWHWVRGLRAAAAFDLDQTSTVALPEAMSITLKALGYGEPLDFRRAVRPPNPGRWGSDPRPSAWEARPC